MPKTVAIRRARRAARQGRKPATQAGEFVRQEMRAMRAGSRRVRSRRQAIAVGLSEARRAGVKVPAKRTARRPRRAVRSRARRAA